MSWENHDTCAASMLDVLAAVEAEQLADRITVVTRTGGVRHGAEELAEGLTAGPQRPPLPVVKVLRWVG